MDRCMGIRRTVACLLASLLACALCACVAARDERSVEALRARRLVGDLSRGTPHAQVLFLLSRVAPSADAAGASEHGLDPLAIENGRLTGKDWPTYRDVRGRCLKLEP
jgi:hypothetical protein